MKQHMLTHKIREMPQHMFPNSVTESSPSSDSNNSLSTLSGSEMSKLNRIQQQQHQTEELQSQSQYNDVKVIHKFDDTQNADRLRRQLNASQKNKKSDIVGSVTKSDQRETENLYTDDSVSMSSPIKPSKAPSNNNTKCLSAGTIDNYDSINSKPSRMVQFENINVETKKYECNICKRFFSTKNNLKVAQPIDK